MLTARAYRYSNGMADSAQLKGGNFWPSPPYTPTPKQEGMRVPTLEYQDQAPGLVMLPMAWVHRGVAVSGSLLHSELSSLGYAGVGLLPDPHARVRLPTFPILPLLLPLLYPHVDVSGWDSLHQQHFPICS